MTDKKQFSVEITETLLDEVIDSFDDLSIQDHSVCMWCLVARAVQPVLGKGTWVNEKAVAKAPFNYFVHEWQGDHVAQRFVTLFDASRYDDIRKQLPATVTFTLMGRD
jgi:hypothetical protein